jgi:cysteate synthase
MPRYLVVPERGLERLLLPIETAPFVVAVKGDYSDAIVLADALAKATNLTRGGGVRNIACRAGLGTVMLNAVVHPDYGSNRLFDHYFQSVSSGSGAIAAWEAVQLLLGDGRFGNTPTKIHVAQNAPFTPIVDAWETALPVVCLTC